LLGVEEGSDTTPRGSIGHREDWRTAPTGAQRPLAPSRAPSDRMCVVHGVCEHSSSVSVARQGGPYIAGVVRTARAPAALVAQHVAPGGTHGHRLVVRARDERGLAVDA